MIFPKKCLGCGKTGSFICKKCELGLEVSNLRCPVCSKPSLTGKSCDKCDGVLDGLVTVWKFNGLAREGIHWFKFKGARDVIVDFVELAGRYINDSPSRFREFGEFVFLDDVVFSFVPSSEKRRKKRGYNQAEIISSEVSKLFRKESVRLLSKVRDTKPQVELSREERLDNLDGIFSFVGDNVPERVVLVDDVVTTGSTLSECAKVLKRAGVSEIWGFALAGS